MFLILLFVFLIIIYFSVFYGLKRTALFFIVFSLLLIPIFCNGFLAVPLLNYLQSKYIPSVGIDKINNISWKKRNAILILGAGAFKKDRVLTPSYSAYSRIEKGVQLYLACKKKGNVCKIVLSGGDPQKRGLSEAEVYQNELQTLGVPHFDIVLENKSNNTYQNAKFSKIILDQGKFDGVFLVTSGFHMRRALLYFSHFDINPKPFISDFFMFSVGFYPSFFKLFATEFAIRECTGMMRFYVYNFLDLNG